MGSLERLEKPRGGEVSKKEEKVLESGREQGPVLGARTVKVRSLHKAEEEEEQEEEER